MDVKYLCARAAQLLGLHPLFRKRVNMQFSSQLKSSSHLKVEKKNQTETNLHAHIYCID